MIAYETSVGSNGYQNLLFPLPYIYISQGEGGSYSHEGTYNIDFLGWGANGRIYHCPYYAPCDLKCKYVSASGVVWESVNMVNFIDGTLDYITLNVVHDNRNTDHYAGEIITQGNLLGYTGTKGNATGDHVHINVSKGLNNYQYQNQYGNWMFTNSYHIYNAMGVNDTVIVQGYGYNWRSFTPGPTPPGPTPPIPPISYTHKTHFKFYLYDRHKN